MDRLSNVSSNAQRSNSVPRAPPLPAPRPFQGVKNAAYKIIGFPPRPVSPDASRSDAKTSPGLAAFGRFTTLGLAQDATASHRTGLAINTLAINEKGTHALVGGREIFKTIRVENGVCVEERNLRTIIRSTPNQASGELRKVYSIDIADVAWAKGDCGDFVAAATTSGKIILYDLGHASLQGTLLHEHARQVHKVTFNPHRGSLLLSGSQDGTVRLWDLRDARSFASTLQSKRKFSGSSDGVRDVKWSPTDGVDFAFSTDSGWIQCWDMRYLKATPKIKIPAHQSSCTSIDWHPDGKHIVSAGMDKTMRIWDFSTTRKHKPAWEVKTPYAISNARWRPACESSMPQDNGARMCTQIATAYVAGQPVVHIWDVRRPTLPFREFTPYISSPTDLLWHSQDLFWSVGREGIFLQTDIHHTTKVIERRSLQAIATSSTGQLSFVSQQRYSPQGGRHRSIPKLQTPKSPSMSQSPEYSFLSRSWADESLDHSFLTVHPRRPSQSRSSTRFSSATATPPSGLQAKPILRLDDILLNRQSFTPEQASFRGQNPLQLTSSMYRTIADAYFASISRDSGDLTVAQYVDSLLQDMVRLYQDIGQHRLAQTWDIVAFAVARHLEKRLSCAETKAKDKPAVFSETLQIMRAVLERGRSPITTPAMSPASLRPVSGIAQALAAGETSSNMTTPLARPHAVTRHTGLSTALYLPDPEADREIAPLSPSLTAQQDSVDAPVTTAGIAETDDKLTHVDLLSPQYQRTTPMPIESTNHVWSPQVKPLLTLEPESDKMPVRPSLLKHDSDESFSFMVGSGSSRDHSLTVSFESNDGKPTSMVKGHLTRPLLRYNSGSPPSDMKYINGHDRVSPDIDRSPQPSLISHRSIQDSMNQTVQQSLTLERPSTANPELRKLRATASFDVEADEMFSLTEMLSELVTHYSATSSNAQAASQLLLTLVPLLPSTAEVHAGLVENVTSVYLDTISSSNSGAIGADKLASIYEWLLNMGLNPLQLESILATYHEQLIANRLHSEAARLRQYAFPIFPAVFEHDLDTANLYLKQHAQSVNAIAVHARIDWVAVYSRSAYYVTTAHILIAPWNGSET